MSFSQIKSIISALMLIAVCCWSCKKQTVYEGTPVMITAFNGMNDGVSLYGNYSDVHPITYQYAQWLPNGAAFRFFVDSFNIRARYFASPDTLVKDQPVLDERLSVEKGKTYSIYVMGDKTGADYLLVDNNLKSYKANDSVTYLQIVNISNDQPISVNIKGDANGSLISNLPFKAASDFIELKADQNHTSYEFEYRDAVTGEFLFNNVVPHIMPPAGETSSFLYKNWTLVFRGIRNVSDINALKVQSIFYQ